MVSECSELTTFALTCFAQLLPEALTLDLDIRFQSHWVGTLQVTPFASSTCIPFAPEHSSSSGHPPQILLSRPLEGSSHRRRALRLVSSGAGLQVAETQRKESTGWGPCSGGPAELAPLAPLSHAAGMVFSLPSFFFLSLWLWLRLESGPQVPRYVASQPGASFCRTMCQPGWGWGWGSLIFWNKLPGLLALSEYKRTNKPFVRYYASFLCFQSHVPGALELQKRFGSPCLGAEGSPKQLVIARLAACSPGRLGESSLEGHCPTLTPAHLPLLTPSLRLGGSPAGPRPGLNLPFEQSEGRTERRDEPDSQEPVLWVPTQPVAGSVTEAKLTWVSKAQLPLL